jgi:signal transduction histidine kinase
MSPITDHAGSLERISDGFLALDTSWRVTCVNAQAERCLHCERDDLLGCDIWSMFPLQETQPLRDACELALRSRSPETVEVHLPSLDANLDVRIYPGKQGKGLTLYIQDLAARNRANMAEAAQCAAEAANQAKTDFLLRMSHELRTPLNTVLGFSQVMRMNPGASLSQPQAEMLAHIESAGRHLLAVISDVLDLSRIEAGAVNFQSDDVDIQILAADCLGMLDTQARTDRITLRVDLDAFPGEVRVDRTRIKQVLLNLLGNAIKYNRPDGAATLAIHRTRGDVYFSVSDTGIGLSDEQMGQLFQPFNRLGHEHSNVPGTGLGLVITHHLVGAMGGSLKVVSRLGRGSVFSFCLPQSDLPNEYR